MMRLKANVRRCSSAWMAFLHTTTATCQSHSHTYIHLVHNNSVLLSQRSTPDRPFISRPDNFHQRYKPRPLIYPLSSPVLLGSRTLVPTSKQSIYSHIPHPQATKPPFLPRSGPIPIAHHRTPPPSHHVCLRYRHRRAQRGRPGQAREEARQVQQPAARRWPELVRGYYSWPAVGGHEDHHGCQQKGRHGRLHCQDLGPWWSPRLCVDPGLRLLQATDMNADIT